MTMIKHKKIAFVLPFYPSGISGGLRVIFQYSNYLVDHNCDVTLYYYIMDTLIKHKIPPILSELFKIYFSKRYPKWFKLDKRIKRISILSYEEIEKNTVDVIIATTVETAKPVWNLYKRITDNSIKMPKKVYFIQGYENWNNTNEFVNGTYSLGMNNITVAKWLSAVVDQYSKTLSYCIPNGIDSKIFYRNYDQRKRAHTLAFHYRSAVYKGCDVAFEVIDLLHKKYEDLEVYVVNPEKKNLFLPNYCREYNCITPQEVAIINNRTKVFLCTSRKEGFGLPGLEAMACGAALVSTSYAGVLEYAIDYDFDKNRGNSLLAPIDDIDGLAYRIMRLFDDEYLYNAIVENAIKTSLEFTIEKSEKQFIRYLNQI